MKKNYVGIDISKEKCNLCYRDGLEIVLEEESVNDVKALKKSLTAALKTFSVTVGEVLVCAEYTGRYIYPLTVACQELDIFLWMDDPTRIKSSMGPTRGKNDAIDAARIAEYAYRYSDKAIRYCIPDAALVSMKSLRVDREFLLIDKKRYQSQITDRKRDMAPGDFKHKCARWKKVIRTIDEQIKAIDAEIESFIAENPVLTRQKELLTSIDGVGDRIAINMIAITGGFTRFQNARQFCRFAGLTPYKYDSGTSVRSKAKISKRANQTMKALLHLAAVGAATHMKESEYRNNSQYDNLCRRGNMCAQPAEILPRH